MPLRPNPPLIPPYGLEFPKELLAPAVVGEVLFVVGSDESIADAAAPDVPGTGIRSIPEGGLLGSLGVIILSGPPAVVSFVY